MLCGDVGLEFMVSYTTEGDKAAGLDSRLAEGLEGISGSQSNYPEWQGNPVPAGGLGSNTQAFSTVGRGEGK